MAAVFSTAADTNGNRVLFIIDCSASMRPFDKGLRESVFELVRTGARGHMANGDTYGIWLVREEIDTTFPMESWGQRYSVELGAKATTHIKKNGYKGKARLDVAFADALRIAKRVGDLTIVLVSNGETPIAGTAFDATINERFRQLAPEMKKAKATLNTALVARDGGIVAWAVNATDVLVAVPFVPIKPKPVAASPTNAPSPSNAKLEAVASNPPTATNAGPVKPRISSKPIIITKDTVAEEKRMYQSLTMIGTSNEATRISAGTNSVTEQTNLASTTPVGVPIGKPITDAVESKPVAAVTNGIQRTSVTNVSGEHATTNTILAQQKLETTNSEAVIPTATKVVSAAPSSTRSELHPILWAAMGAGIALIVVLAVIFTVRSRRPEPSLISRSIGFDRIHSSKI